MKRESDPLLILQRLLDRYERRSNGGRRISERPAQSFESAVALQMLVEGLKSAEAAGCVQIEFDRDAPHLIARVILADAQKLYAFLSRTPRQIIAETATNQLHAIFLKTSVAEMLRSDFVAAWRKGKRWLKIDSNNVAAAVNLLVAADAAFTDLDEDVPIRTRSARLLGDSKALERAMPPLLGYLKLTGMIDAELSRADALAQLGLAKYPQPILVAGPLVIGGADVGSWPYAGIPADLLTEVAVSKSIRSILTVENLESFNRHVRCCRGESDIVLYTGGFPGRSVVALLRRLVSHKLGGIHHWGDIDPGGLGIARFLETSVPVPVYPHLMSPQLAASAGKTPLADAVVPHLPEDSSFYELALYLMQSDARWLEQEVVDPVPVMRDEASF